VVLENEEEVEDDGLVAANGRAKPLGVSVVYDLLISSLSSSPRVFGERLKL
jgi:hypothetical protein